jgi:predicted  nucleic acid-binding Zn-ribbon protein
MKRVVGENLQKFCEGLVSEWEQLERDFSFISQERDHDMTEFLSQLTDLKTQLSLQREQLPSASDNLTNLEERITQLKSIFEHGQVLQDKLKEIHFKRDESLLEEERQLLNAISPDNSAIAISQLRQNLPHNQEVWELLKTLYKKGHLEIMLRRRD